MATTTADLEHRFHARHSGDWRPPNWPNSEHWAEESCTRLMLCGVCHHLRGPAGPGRTQHCRCAPDPLRGEDQAGWQRHDIRSVASLCRCCGSELLHSGSRWAPFFCDDCEDQASALNDQVGRLVVPIGAHSIMNRVSLRGSDAVADPAVLVKFARSARGFTDGVGRLYAIETEAVRDRCREANLFGGRALDVSLLEYLAAVAQLHVDKRAAFATLVDRMAHQPLPLRSVSGAAETWSGYEDDFR